jgi:hypothetical protein
MRHYCTLFDRNYLARGVALHHSLMRHGGQFELHVLCLDEATLRALSALALPNTEIVGIGELERWDPELRAARAGRTPPEYYFTCKPVLLAYLLERHPDADRITYLDSDLYFFSDAATAERALRGSPVALSPHRFGANSAHRKRFGEFNAGWISIDSGAQARRFVAWWRERCLEWCRLVVEETRFGDQKYLDRVPALFPDAKVVHHPGINAGPWNLDPRAVRLSAGRVLMADEPLVVFHFHGMRRMLFGWYDCGLYEYGLELTPAIKTGIYRPYVAEIARCERQVASLPNAEPAAPRQRGVLRQAALTARALLRQSALRAAA